MKFDFVIPQVKTDLKEYYGLVIWNLIPAEVKYVDSLETFKSKVRM